MFFIPGWISIILLFGTIFLSGHQHVRIAKPNPVRTSQFFMMIFCLILIVVIDLRNRDNPWLSLGFFLVSLGSFAFMIRQRRFLPPRERLQ